VATEYSAVPPVASIRHVTPHGVDAFLPSLDRDCHFELSQKAIGLLSGLMGKWIVSFRCSWDTDDAGLPETLHVSVDDTKGEAERTDLDVPDASDPGTAPDSESP